MHLLHETNNVMTECRGSYNLKWNKKLETATQIALVSKLQQKWIVLLYIRGPICLLLHGSCCLLTTNERRAFNECVACLHSTPPILISRRQRRGGGESNSRGRGGGSGNAGVLCCCQQRAESGSPLLCVTLNWKKIGKY